VVGGFARTCESVARGGEEGPKRPPVPEVVGKVVGNKEGERAVDVGAGDSAREVAGEFAEEFVLGGWAVEKGAAPLQFVDEERSGAEDSVGC